jgi:arylsulfatase A-like enzyme
MKGEMSLMDIAPTILELLGIEGDFAFNGESIFGKPAMENS